MDYVQSLNEDLISLREKLIQISDLLEQLTTPVGKCKKEEN